MPDYASYHDLINPNYMYGFDPRALDNPAYVERKLEELTLRLDVAIGGYKLQRPEEYVSSTFNFNAAQSIAERIKELHCGSADDIH